MARISLEFHGFNEVLKKLNKLEADTKSIAEEALTKTFDIVTDKAEAAVATSNLPRGGVYSTGRTMASLRRTPEITWNGTEGTVRVGFNIKKGGLPTIFMMYGTPRYMKVQAVYDAFYGTQTEGEITNVQKEIFYRELERLIG